MIIFVGWRVVAVALPITPARERHLVHFLVERLYWGWSPQRIVCHVRWWFVVYFGPAVLHTWHISSTPSALAGERSRP